MSTPGRRRSLRALNRAKARNKAKRRLASRKRRRNPRY